MSSLISSVCLCYTQLVNLFITWEARWVEMFETSSALPVTLVAFLISGLLYSSSQLSSFSLTSLTCAAVRASFDSSTGREFGSSLSSYSISASNLAWSDVTPSFSSSTALQSSRVVPPPWRARDSCSYIARLYSIASASWASSSASICYCLRSQSFY